jgi:hypothetical protein
MIWEKISGGILQEMCRDETISYASKQRRLASDNGASAWQQTSPDFVIVIEAQTVNCLTAAFWLAHDAIFHAFPNPVEFPIVECSDLSVVQLDWFVP